MAKKRDINLLESLNQSNKKKSSSSMTAILAVAIIVLIGAMVFLFASAKVQTSKNNEIIADLDNQLAKEDEVAQLEQEYINAQNEYASKISAVIGAVYPNLTATQAKKISSTFYNIVFGYAADNQDHEGNPAVKISSYTLSGTEVSLTCATNNHEDAWQFVRFLAGRLDTDESRQNLLYFSNVEANYPGLPADVGAEYGIAFSLTFNVNWGAFV